MPLFEYDWSGVTYDHGAGVINAEDEEDARNLIETKFGYAFDELEIAVAELEGEGPDEVYDV